MWNRIKEVMDSKGAMFAVGSVLGVAAGASSTYFLTKDRLKKEFEQELTEEVQKAKDYHARLNKTGEFADPVTALQHLETVAKDLQYNTQSDIVEKVEGIADDVEQLEVIEEVLEQTEKGLEAMDAPEDPVQNMNVFDQAKQQRPVEIISGAEDWDYEIEISKRNAHPGLPYIIHVDEFNENESDFEQTSLTYFAEDDILVDDRDDVIPDAEPIVGESNLDQFGRGSKDPNIVHVRNEQLEMDFEIVRHEGSYAKQVHGFDASDSSLKHSDRHGSRRKFRHEDE